MKNENFLTTRQLAHLWQVSAATIKRWADAGHLQSNRTLGGHRRFALAEVARFQNERGFGAPTPTKPEATARRKASHVAASHRRSSANTKTSRAKAERERRAVAENFFNAIIDGRDGVAMAVMLQAYLQGKSLVNVIDETVTTVMHRIGGLWHVGDLSVADEHLATRTAIRALEAMSVSVRRRYTEGRLAICCAAEDELHELPILCAQILLENEGWRVKNFGANTPFFALAEAVEKHRPNLVCISSTTLLSLERSSREYMQFYVAARACGARIVLGGSGFSDEAVQQRFPADLYAENFTQLIDFVNQ
ncbi:MAG TPA: B12-binding domain-containing protein [Pyrinomonadaceae bacterium]|jgi:excisionase family DNA binding protein